MRGTMPLEIARLLNDTEMARFLMVIPHPFVEFDARTLVKAAWRRLTGGRGFDLLITVKDGGDRPVGSVGVGLHDEGARGELGFWIGRDYWGGGYASEAARRMIEFATETLGVTRLTGTVAADNDGLAGGPRQAGLRRDRARREARAVDRRDARGDLFRIRVGGR